MRSVAWALVLVVATAASPAAAQDMPDPSLIHGRAIPAPELPAGTITVRVVREAIGNDVPDQQVRLTVGETTFTATTDDLGRAEFPALPRGAEARAEAVVDGETLVSQPLAVPASGGLRVILVAGMAEAAARRAREEAAAAAAPAVAGAVVLGGNSRVILQLEEETLQVFYLLDIVNNARAPVDVGGPLVLDLPRGAGGATILEGSTPLATVSGDRVTIRGPFAPGSTPLQVAYRLRYDSREFRFQQAWPAALQQVTVGVEKIGDLRVSSPQFATTNDVQTDEGRLFVLGSGPTLPAGTTLDVTIANLPLHSRMPRYVALSLAIALGVLGIWLAATPRRTVAVSAGALAARREALLNDGARLEAQHRSGALDQARYERRRQRIVAELEQIYAQLDDAQAGSPGGGAGVAA
jgi:hypothetical protein